MYCAAGLAWNREKNVMMGIPLQFSRYRFVGRFCAKKYTCRKLPIVSFYVFLFRKLISNTHYCYYKGLSRFLHDVILNSPITSW